jgi:hypothetical protein
MKAVFLFGFVFALIFHSPLCAQTAASASADASATNSTQAPDDATRKISELVHAGQYADAQKLTEGLLLAYPNDQRLIKAKALIEKLMANGDSAGSATAGGSQPAADASQLTGMDKVDYNALIALVRQAQQDMDMTEQTKLLQQFMDQSSVFLQQHPEQMLLWQLRAASAISLNEPMEGYEAGQKLISAGAANSNDANLQNLLGQLKNRGWLDRQEVEKQTRYDWLIGVWSGHYSWVNKKGRDVLHGDFMERFTKTDTGFEGRSWAVGKQEADGNGNVGVKITILDSGDMDMTVSRSPDWVHAATEVSSDKRTLKATFTAKAKWTCGAFSSTCEEDRTYTGVFTKNGP